MASEPVGRARELFSSGDREKSIWPSGMLGNIPYIFECRVDTVVNLLLLNSSMVMQLLSGPDSNPSFRSTFLCQSYQWYPIDEILMKAKI